MECERYNVSDRTGAKLANALLKDLGIAHVGNSCDLICPTRLRRQRQKWGENQEIKNIEQINLTHGLYSDGKRIPTLVKDIKETRVPIHCSRGRKRYKTVFTTGNKSMIEDHEPVIAEPGGNYISHVTPSDGTGRTLAKELVSVIISK